MNVLAKLFLSAALLFVPALLLAKPAGHPARSLAAPALARALAGVDTAPMPHPRLFGGAADYAGIVAAAKAERASGLAALADYLKRHSARALAPPLLAQLRSDDPAVRSASWWQQDRLLEGIAESAFVWYVTREPWFLDEMRARLQLFGSAILDRQCRGDVAETRDYVWYFALAYDFTAGHMDDADRQLVQDVVNNCAGASLAGTPATLRAHPDNPVAFNALGKFVGAMLILRGDMPDAAAWLDDALPAYVAALSPWGGEDGGFANGSSYALWDAGESLLAWDLVERVLRVPLYDKPWLMNLPRFIAYTLPPATPAGAFGDGAEVKRTEEWARLGKAIALRSPSPLARWYAQQLQGEDPARLQSLLSPRLPAGSWRLPASAPDSALFASVGVAAMHSALADPQRVSVLFRSSPFGSVSHAHADQNSFVLYAKGQVLAMDSGVYDAYNSPHWRNWYKQTKAHNAITFDDGQGQELGKSGQGERGANGAIVRFTDDGPWVLAQGEAAPAYGAGVEQARRTLVYLRPSTLLIVDQLASDRPHKWEWNLHTGAALKGTPDGFTTQAGAVRLCGQVAASEALDMRSSSGYAPAPSTPAGPHYWSRFAYQHPADRALFVATLRVDCAGAAPAVDFSGDGAAIGVAGMTIKVGADGVSMGDDPQKALSRPAPRTSRSRQRSSRRYKASR